MNTPTDKQTASATPEKVRKNDPNLNWAMYNPEKANPRTIPAEKPTTWIQQANGQMSGLIATLEEMATYEAGQGDGWFATDHLSNIRYVLDKLYEAKDAMEVL